MPKKLTSDSAPGSHVGFLNLVCFDWTRMWTWYPGRRTSAFIMVLGFPLATLVEKKWWFKKLPGRHNRFLTRQSLAFFSGN